MLLLSADTSGRNGSLALARIHEQDFVEIVEVVPLSGGAFSAQLVPQIASALERHGFHKSDIAGFAVVSGPGSFTGLRVGLAAIKAMAEVLCKPIAAISLLEALARSRSTPGRVFSVLDAGRGEIYVGDYELGLPVPMLSERLMSREEFVARAAGQLVVTADAAIAQTLRDASLDVQVADYPGADVIARLGWERIRRGETVRPEDLEANYLRKSDAEIFSQPKS